ncbi:MAG: RidA family protein [Thermodesulfobacteriota bacterium]|nr:RidA family protein [Thermodesulfobacteriota bacterium]
MTIKERLAQMGLTLPEAPNPVAAYAPSVRAGDLVFVSGQLPLVQGELTVRGRAGTEVSLDEAKKAAQIAALNCLSVVQTESGLDNIIRIVKLTGYVASGPDFFDQPQVVNGASELLQEVFGPAGRHARAAVGVSALPLGSPVEIEMIVQVKT